MNPTIEAISEDTLRLRFGTRVDPTLNAEVHAAVRMLRAAHLPTVLDIAPAYASLLLRFDPGPYMNDGETPPHQRLIAELQSLLNRIPERPAGAPAEQTTHRSIEIPVCYGGEFGPDLAELTAHAGISADAAVTQHTASDYTVAMLGFAPGFPYLLGLDSSLHMPRRAAPRTRVPTGSVAIGGAQTGIYPRALPGGWNLIGRTPLTLFDPQRTPPCVLAPGDHVRFQAISTHEFTLLTKHTT